SLRKGPSPSHPPYSCSGRTSQLLLGDTPRFPSPRGGRGGQPRLPGRRVALADVGPGGDHEHGLVVLGPSPGIKREGISSAPADGVGDSGPPQGTQGGGVATALGREVTAEAKHVRPLAQP